MKIIDLIVILSILVIVSIIVGRYIYKRKNNLPTGECACCSSKNGVKRMLKNVQNEINKENCCCNKTS